MPVTQADVARLAGVSQRTVSNVVNNFPYVSAEVATRVKDAIESLGYTPSHAARSLRSGRSGVIQLVIPELDVPYFAELARGVVKFAEDDGYAVMVRQTLGEPSRERDALEGSAADYAEGTILSAVAPVEELLPATQRRTPVVLIGERSGQGLVDHIGIDDVEAARVATSHLIGLGRRRIAFVGADPVGDLRMASMRLRGFRQAHLAAGLEVDESLVVRTAAYHRRDGHRAVVDLLSRPEPPDALFCATDLVALGALRAAHDFGAAVPEDLAVVGFDGLEEGEFAVPALSTVAPDKQAIARRAVARLIELISSPADRSALEPSDVLVPFELLVRTSTVRAG